MSPEDRATATGDLHKKFCEDQSSGSRDISWTDTHTHIHTQRDRCTDRQTDRNTPLPYQDGV